MTAPYTRRGAVAAALALPCIAAAAAMPATAAPPVDRTAWDRAMADYGLKRAAYEQGSDRSDAVCDAYLDAEEVLFLMPAPDVAALAWKLAFLLQEDGSGYTASWAIDFVAPTVADARRLAAADDRVPA